jgi:hypothetical protein
MRLGRLLPGEMAFSCFAKKNDTPETKEQSGRYNNYSNYSRQGTTERIEKEPQTREEEQTYGYPEACAASGPPINPIKQCPFLRSASPTIVTIRVPSHSGHGLGNGFPASCVLIQNFLQVKGVIRQTAESPCVA